jgi:CRP-like cAMP-binding protein
MVEGMAFGYKTVPSGQRQILSIVMPGDICDLSSIFFPQLDYDIEAAMDCEIAVAKRQTVIDAIAAHPDIGRALWWVSQAGEAISENGSSISVAGPPISASHIFSEKCFCRPAQPLWPMPARGFCR